MHPRAEAGDPPGQNQVSEERRRNRMLAGTGQQEVATVLCNI